MVWYFIGVYIINRTLHDRLEIRNFSSRVENISTLEEKFRISARPCNILYIFVNNTQLRDYRKASKTSFVESLPLFNDRCCFIVQKQMEFSIIRDHHYHF